MHMTNPTGRNTEARKVIIEDVVLYFSYETLVAVRGYNGLRRTDVNYSRTTNKHMREMDIFDMPEMDDEEMYRYAEVSIMTALMSKHLPTKETNDAT